MAPNKNNKGRRSGGLGTGAGRTRENENNRNGLAGAPSTSKLNAFNSCSQSADVIKSKAAGHVPCRQCFSLLNVVVPLCTAEC